MPEAAAQFKKQDGKLAVSADGRAVSWKASSGGSVLDIAVADISSMSPIDTRAHSTSLVASR